VIVALVQGGLGAATFWIVGLPAALLWGLLMALTSLLPALGPAIVWVPVAVYLLATTAIWQGLVVIISGVVVIGMADNILRPILVGRDTGIPDFVVLVTTLGGIELIGLSGIVVGPLVAALFLASWQILTEQRHRQRASARRGPTGRRPADRFRSGVADMKKPPPDGPEEAFLYHLFGEVRQAVAAFSLSTRSVRSQVKLSPSGSRPKWPYAAVFL
jgi:hypothetical protein